jgi:hypothetical protein
LAVTETTKLKLQKQDAGDAGWHTAVNTTFDRVEAKLAKSCAGDPNPTKAGESAGDYVGQVIYDTTNKILWYCTTAGAAGTAIWERQVIDLSYAGTPQGNVAGAYIGQRCFDTTNVGWWTCTTVGDAGTAVWAADIPPKTVWSFSGTSIPAGWLLCDGTSGTPDLGGMFIVGYDAGDADYDAIADTGGNKEHTLAADELPDHIHTSKQDARAAGGGTCADSGFGSGSDQVTNSSGGGDPQQAIDIRPPFYTLAYMMKKPVV